MAYIQNQEILDAIIVRNGKQLVVPYYYEDNTLKTDTPLADILAAIEAGRPVIATIGTYVFGLSTYGENFVIFASNNFGSFRGIFFISHSISDDVETVETMPLSYAGDYVFCKINYTLENNAYVADKSQLDIIEAVSEGRIPRAYVTLENNTIIQLDYVKQYVFSGIIDDTVYVLNHGTPITLTTYDIGDLADGSVTTAKLANSAVTSAKLANASVGINHMQASSVGYVQLIDGVVTPDKTDFFEPLDLTGHTTQSTFYEVADLDNYKLYIVTVTGRIGHAYVDPDNDTNIENKQLQTRAGTIIFKNNNAVYCCGGTQPFIFNLTWEGRTSSLSSKGVSTIWTALVDAATNIDQGVTSSIEEFCSTLLHNLGAHDYA